MGGWPSTEGILVYTFGTSVTVVPSKSVRSGCGKSIEARILASSVVLHIELLVCVFIFLK